MAIVPMPEGPSVSQNIMKVDEFSLVEPKRNELEARAQEKRERSLSVFQQACNDAYEDASDTIVRDAYNKIKQEVEALKFGNGDGKSGFLNQKDIVGVNTNNSKSFVQTVEEDVNKIIDENSKGLDSYQRKKLKRYADSIREGTRGEALNHQIKQYERFRENSFRAKIAGSADTIASNPAGVVAELQSMGEEFDSMYKGAPAEHLKQIKQDAAGSAVGNSLDGCLGRESMEEARKLLDDSKPYLSAVTYATLERKFNRKKEALDKKAKKEGMGKMFRETHSEIGNANTAVKQVFGENAPVITKEMWDNSIIATGGNQGQAVVHAIVGDERFKEYKQSSDMSKQYNTKLSAEYELLFQQWAKAQNRLGDLSDYDMRGAWLEAVTKDPSLLNRFDWGGGEGGHFTDKYKKPNHPTFSNESKYSGVDGFEGGQWWTTPDGRKVFTPVRGYTKEEYQAAQKYMERADKGVILDVGGKLFNMYEPSQRLPYGAETGNYNGPVHTVTLEDSDFRDKGLDEAAVSAVKAYANQTRIGTSEDPNVIYEALLVGNPDAEQEDLERVAFKTARENQRNRKQKEMAVENALLPALDKALAGDFEGLDSQVTSMGRDATGYEGVQGLTRAAARWNDDIPDSTDLDLQHRLLTDRVALSKMDVTQLCSIANRFSRKDFKELVDTWKQIREDKVNGIKPSNVNANDVRSAVTEVIGSRLGGFRNKLDGYPEWLAERRLVNMVVDNIRDEINRNRNGQRPSDEEIRAMVDAQLMRHGATYGKRSGWGFSTSDVNLTAFDLTKPSNADEFADAYPTFTKSLLGGASMSGIPNAQNYDALGIYANWIMNPTKPIDRLTSQGVMRSLKELDGRVYRALWNQAAKDGYAEDPQYMTALYFNFQYRLNEYKGVSDNPYKTPKTQKFGVPMEPILW